MPYMKIELEKGEKFPEISTSNTGKREIMVCPNCKEKFSIFLHYWNKKKYLKGECEVCGYRKCITPKECDIIQPSSPLFKLLYGFNPNEDNKRIKKNLKWYKEKRKEIREENLNRKVKEEKLKTTDLKNIKSYVRDRGIE